MKPLGAALVFFAEIGMYICLALTGWAWGVGFLRIVLAVLLPVVGAALWAIFMAPKAPRKLKMPWLVIARIDHIVVASVLAFISGYPVLAIVTTALMLIGTPLAGDLTKWPGGERVPG